MKQLHRIVGQATELGFTMGLTAAGLILGSLWLGRWIDNRLGTAPYVTLLLLLSGLVAGQVAIFRMAKRATERLSSDAPNAWEARTAGTAIGMAFKALALVALPGGLGLVIGLQVDRLVGSLPWFTLGLSLAGSILGLWITVRMVQGASAPAGKGDR